MTTKLKANKFRIRKPSVNKPTTPRPMQAVATDPVDQTPAVDQTAPMRQPASEPTQAAAPEPLGQDLRSDPTLKAIQNEGLTPRQLRIARRTAQKQGLTFTSDYEAVKVLRDNGIDPFQRSTMMQVVAQNDPDNDKVQLPTRIEPAQVPAEQAQMSPEDMAAKRNKEIMGIQKDMIRRRRRNSLMLTLRLMAFVLIPTLLAGIYFTMIATPMYSTNSAFQIIKADSAGAAGGAGGLLSGTQFATTPDAIAVQTYLTSKDAMLRLEEDEGFVEHFSDPNIDVLQRLKAGATLEDAHKIYKKRIKIGFDPTEGVVNMEVSAADPDMAVRFSEALIKYAEERVDNLSERKRDNQVSDAKTAFEDADKERRKAQEALVALQQSTLLDPEAYAGSLRGQISTLEQQIVEKEIQLQALLDNARPNQSRVSGVRADIDRLKFAKAETEARMNEPMENGMTLAETVSRIQISQADLATRDAMLQASLEQLRATQAEASSQSRYLTLAVDPIASESPSYPKAFEDTLLTLLILSGIYLMISITASILKEQIS